MQVQLTNYIKATNMKTTPFTEIHKALGAKMHEFAGYDMPIEYPTGIIEEHMTVVKGVGVFDVSHMGEFWVKGPNALRFIQDITTNDASKLKVGDIQYHLASPTEQGGIVDDLLVYHYEDEKYLLVVNAANIEKDWAWCQYTQRRWRYPREQLRQRRSARHPGPSGTAGPAAPDGCRPLYHPLLHLQGRYLRWLP